MSLSSFLRGIIGRFRMACVYNDDSIRAFQGIEEGAIIQADIKLKWKMESDKNDCDLWAMKEREHQADKAQGVYAEGLEPVEAFPVPVKVEPVPIDEAANTPNALKQIFRSRSSTTSPTSRSGSLGLSWPPRRRPRSTSSTTRRRPTCISNCSR